MEKLYDRCLRCNRKLKTDEARHLGYGKICFEKANHFKVIRLFEDSAITGKWEVIEKKKENLK